MLTSISNLGEHTWVTNLDISDIASLLPSQAEVFGISRDQLPVDSIQDVLKALVTSHQKEDNSQGNNTLQLLHNYSDKVVQYIILFYKIKFNLIIA